MFLPHYCHFISKHISKCYWYIINRITLLWWRIKIGRDCRFQGKTIFTKLPDTKINIGSKCTFLSNHRSNLIGVYTPCMISTLSKKAIINIGNGCGFSGTVIGAAISIKIGNNVRCGANTLITDTDWHTDDFRTGLDKPIIIEDDVWLGYGVKVLKGVHIGKGSLIGAMSVVTKDIPEGVIAAGNPCKVIKKI